MARMRQANIVSLSWGMLAFTGLAALADPVVLQGDPRRLPKEIVEAAARLSVPLSIPVAAGDTVRNVVKTFCGYVTSGYEQLLEEKVPALNPDLPAAMLDVPVGESRSVRIPYCFQTPKLGIKAITVQPDDSVWKFWKGTDPSIDCPLCAVTSPTIADASKVEYPGPLNQDATTSLEKLQDLMAQDLQPSFDALAKDFSWQNYATAFEKTNAGLDNPGTLVPGEIVNMPLLPKLFYSLDFPSAADQQAFETTFASIDPADAGVVAIDSANPAYGELEGFVGEDELKALGEDCGADEAWVFARSQEWMASIARAIVDNAQMRPAGYRTTNARVLIADSGLDGYVGDYGSPPFVAGGIVAFEIGGSAAQIRSDQMNPKHAHGTSVASIVLGGPLLAWTNALARGPIELAFTRVDEGRVIDSKLQYPVTMDRLGSGVGGRLNNDSAVTVVNMSFEFDRSPSAFFGSYIKDKPQPLFVIAAGNGKQDLEQQPAWPAFFGGGDNRNVLTVAAVDWSNDLAEFSNRSEKYVDIAAPGCRVAVLRFDEASSAYVVEYDSGTSMAAPWVSHAAALLKAEMPTMRMSRVRDRLLYTADFNPKLAGHVREGRQLNVERALSIFSDLVEFRSTPSLRGDIEFTNGPQPVQLCKGKATISPSELRRIALLEAAGGPRLKVFYEQDLGDNELRLVDQECPVADASAEPGLRDRQTKKLRALKWNELRNITFSLAG